MKASIPIEIVVAVLAAISCLVTLPQFGLPVWALFIAWAWYFALGATPAVFKMAYPAALAGAVLAAACIWLIGTLMGYMALMPAMMLAVFITVLLLMLVLRLPATSCSLAAFNGYSVVFATYYGGFFHKSGSAELDILMAFAFSIVAMLLGPVFGYFSIYFTFPRQEENKTEDMGL